MTEKQWHERRDIYDAPPDVHPAPINAWVDGYNMALAAMNRELDRAEEVH